MAQDRTDPVGAVPRDEIKGVDTVDTELLELAATGVDVELFVLSVACGTPSTLLLPLKSSSVPTGCRKFPTRVDCFLLISPERPEDLT